MQTIDRVCDRLAEKRYILLNGSAKRKKTDQSNRLITSAPRISEKFTDQLLSAITTGLFRPLCALARWGLELPELLSSQIDAQKALSVHIANSPFVAGTCCSKCSRVTDSVAWSGLGSSAIKIMLAFHAHLHVSYC